MDSKEDLVFRIFQRNLEDVAKLYSKSFDEESREKIYNAVLYGGKAAYEIILSHAKDVIIRMNIHD